MIIGAYFTFLNIVLEYGELAAWPMLAFVTSLPVAGLAVFGTWVARRMESTSWVMRFFLTELFAFA
ncbi:MAG: hypothetical protein JW834_04155, partial [Candidatus Diapherotrites archaeon]|nr:hypothetical protein [Candidatus Diapherotrites archaeon]